MLQLEFCSRLLTSTHLDHSADVAHQPRLALHALFGVLGELHIMRDLALRGEFFAVSISIGAEQLHEGRERRGIAHLVLTVIPRLDIVGLPNAKRTTSVDQGSVGIAMVGGNDTA